MLIEKTATGFKVLRAARGQSDLLVSRQALRIGHHLCGRRCMGRSKFRPRGGVKTGHHGGHWPRSCDTKILYTTRTYTASSLRTVVRRELDRLPTPELTWSRGHETMV